MKRVCFLCTLVALIIISTSQTFAQNNPEPKFGKVSPRDFSPDLGQVDTTTGAVIIADVGSSSFVGNNSGWFTLVYKHYRRVKILDRNGFGLANVEIPLYVDAKNNNEEKVDKLKAVTYNLENGQVVETKLKDDAVFKEVVSKNLIRKKFTLPNINPGSIIEYSYTINSDFLFNLQPWNFQGAHPRLWSEYEVKIPEFFEYVFIAQGYRDFDVFDKKQSSDVYYVREQNHSAFSKDEQHKLTAKVNENRWVMKNVAPIKEEKYITTTDNYIARIRFQLSAYLFPNTQRKEISSSWMKVGAELREHENFGMPINAKNNWLDSECKAASGGASSQEEKLKNIYKYVQASYRSTGFRGIYLSKSLKDIVRDKSGYNNEINLLLTAILKHEGYPAEAVILSTISNGRLDDTYPIMDRLNYVICKVELNDKSIFLDASQSYLGFGKLPAYAYNGIAQEIGQICLPVMLSPDSLKESSLTSIMLFNDPSNPAAWSGNYNNQFGYMESSNIRRYIQEKGQQALIKELNDHFPEGYTVDETELEAVHEQESSLKVYRKLTIERSGNPSVIYFNPMLDAGYRDNPFKLANRSFPVEMPYKRDEVYVFKIDIPVGYVVDEIPKSEKMTLNESDGFFEYIVSQTDKDISIRSRLKLDRATFDASDYASLQQMYDQIVRKHNEKIVFKKK